MGTKAIHRKILSLVQLEMDAIHAYQHAVNKIDHLEVQEQLVQFQTEHERHFEELSARLSDGEIPEEPDIKGYLIEAFTTIRSSTGTRGALRAMHATEKLINHRYGEVLREDFPADLRSLLEGYLQDEAKHFEYIEQAISEKVWEQPAGRMMHDQLIDALKKRNEEVKKPGS